MGTKVWEVENNDLVTLFTHPLPLPRGHDKARIPLRAILIPLPRGHNKARIPLRAILCRCRGGTIKQGFRCALSFAAAAGARQSKDSAARYPLPLPRGHDKARIPLRAILCRCRGGTTKQGFRCALSFTAAAGAQQSNDRCSSNILFFNRKRPV